MSDAPTELTLTREESAFFVRAFWTALCSPKWPRTHLIELGHLVHSKTPLKNFSEAQLVTFMQYLREIAQSFGEAVSKQVVRTSPLSTEEIARLIKILWEGLLAPAWTPDELIELGKCVFPKIPLSKLGERQFSILFPHLTLIASKVGTAMLSSAAPATPDPVAPAPQPKEETPTVAEEKKEEPNG